MPFLRVENLKRLGRPHRRLPSVWDAVAIAVVFAVFVGLIIAFRQMSLPIATVEKPIGTLAPSVLPLYALRTTLRMLAALVASLVFSIMYGSLAAKSRRLEIVLVPILDVLQSVPILGYISFTVIFFMSLFPGKVMGAELACIFAIFTGQAWNMTFSFYQSLRTLPPDLGEAARSFHFSAWQRFVRLELPFAMPGLIWNMMISMSGGWFFIVAAEAVRVGNLEIDLPGIGSYLALAIRERSLPAVGWSVATMGFVILVYDQLLFRPLVAWGDKFRFDTAAGVAPPPSWFGTLLRRSRLLRQASRPALYLFRASLRLRLRAPEAHLPLIFTRNWNAKALDAVWYAAIVAVALLASAKIYQFVSTELSLSDVLMALRLGFYTLIRVVGVTLIASIFWVPVSVYVGLRPRLAQVIQPVAQFLAAFPANLLFPVAVVLILRWSLNPNIWLSPLVLLGAQWYIVFNVIAGTMAFPHDLREAARNFHITGILWWKKVMLPGILPYYITGALTATGSGWNATIVAEAVSWGDQAVRAQGLGAYIADMTETADYPRILLGIIVMSVYVLLFNRMLWRPLYKWSERRFKLA